MTLAFIIALVVTLGVAGFVAWQNSPIEFEGVFDAPDSVVFVTFSIDRKKFRELLDNRQTVYASYSVDGSEWRQMGEREEKQ